MKRELMSAKTRKHLLKRTGTLKLSPCLLSKFIADPIESRLSLIEITTLMSDYRTAYHIAH